jgi:hypothetical protein
VQGSGDAIWDDGEWISWDYINQQINGPQPEGGLLEDMIVVAKEYLEDMGRHLPIYGEIGEYYAARRFGIELHEDPKTQGSDGRLGNALVEIKTITPMRSSRHVRVKKSGNFGYLVIVKIDVDFRIDAKLISRKRLVQLPGDYYYVGWNDHPSEKIQAEQDASGNRQ